MRKVILFVVFLLVIITPPTVFANSIQEQTDIQEWIDSIRGERICPNADKNNDFLKENYPKTYKKIMEEIDLGNFSEARNIADKLALKLEWGYDGEKIFSISNLIKKEVKKVFKSKDLERKKLFILKNEFDDIGLKNYKRIASEKDFIFSEEVQTKIKNKKISLQEGKEKEKFRKKLLKYKLVMEE